MNEERVLDHVRPGQTEHNPSPGPVLAIDVGQKHCGVCVWDPNTQDILLWAIWELPGTCALDVITAFNAYMPGIPSGVTTVVIEHQPLKNPTMVRLMYYMECFFAMHKMTVHFQDAKKKLLYASMMPCFPEDCTDREWTYHYRKKLAVQTVDAFLTTSQQRLAHVFRNSKKKDDLADALLHAMAYVSLGNVIRRDQAAAPSTAKVTARAPTPNQHKRGKLSASNVKFLLRETAIEDIPQRLASNKTLKRCFDKHFVTMENYLQRCR